MIRLDALADNITITITISGIASGAPSVGD